MTPTQTAFIQSYVTDLGYLRKKLAKSQYEDFARRYNKAEEAMKVLPDGHAALAGLQQLLQAADDTAQTGAFKQAYRMLEQIKADCYTSRNGYLGGLTAQSLKPDIDTVAADMATAKQQIDTAQAAIERLMDPLRNHETAQDQDSFEDACVFLRDFALARSVVTRDIEARTQTLAQKSADAVALDIPAQIAAIRRKVGLVEKDGRMGEISEQVARLIATERLADANGGFYVDSSVVGNKIKAYLREVESRIAEISSLNRFRSDKTSKQVAADEKAAMTGGVADAAAERDPVAVNLKDSAGKAQGTATLFEGEEPLKPTLEVNQDGGTVHVFERLLREDEARINRALDRMRREKNLDNVILDNPANRGREYAPQIPAQLDHFDAGTVLAQAFPPQPLPAEIDNMEIMRRTGASNKAVKTFLDTVDPDSEELLDLILMDPKQLFAMVATQAGVPTDPDACTEDHRALINAVTQGVQQTINENSPNKMATDASSIKVGGTTYQLDKVLGKGGFGTARRFVDPATGDSIVVKSLNNASDDEGRKKMAAEMQTHARALKGDLVESKTHIADMQGAAVSDDGALHMVMTDIGGTDMQKAGNVMQTMAESGMIPQQARQALSRDLVRQTIEGLRYMEERNLIHNDLKPENILVGPDGTVKIIDFGESRFADAAGDGPSAREAGFETTRAYEAPEQYGRDGTVTTGVDTWALGGIIGTMSGHRGENPLGDAVSDNWQASDKTLGAMDRVMGATLATDASERPSLSAIETSAYLSDHEDTRDYLPQDVADLKEASTEVILMLGGLKASFPPDTFNKGYLNDGKPCALPEMQRLVLMFEGDIVKARRVHDATDDLDTKKRKSAEIKAMEEDINILRQARDKAIKDTRDAGTAEYEAMMGDELRIVTMPDNRLIPITAAVAERDASLKTASKLRGAFWRAEQDYKDKHTAHMARMAEADELDALLIELDILALENAFHTQIRRVNAKLKDITDAASAINTAISENLKNDLSPDAKFVLSEKKLKEVGARFG